MNQVIFTFLNESIYDSVRSKNIDSYITNPHTKSPSLSPISRPTISLTKTPTEVITKKPTKVMTKKPTKALTKNPSKVLDRFSYLPTIETTTFKEPTISPSVSSSIVSYNPSSLIASTSSSAPTLSISSLRPSKSSTLGPVLIADASTLAPTLPISMKPTLSYSNTNTFGQKSASLPLLLGTIFGTAILVSVILFRLYRSRTKKVLPATSVEKRPKNGTKVHPYPSIEKGPKNVAKVHPYVDPNEKLIEMEPLLSGRNIRSIGNDTYLKVEDIEDEELDQDFDAVFI